MRKAAISDYTPLPSREDQYSLKFMENRGVLLLAVNEGERPLAGICDPKNSELMEELEEFHRGEVDFVHIDYEEFSAWLTGLLSDTGGFTSAAYGPGKIEIDRLTDDAPVINLVNSLFIEAIRKKASDIHIEGMKDAVRVRCRIDGVLKEISTHPPALFQPIASRIKIMANLNIMERRLPQDGRISINIGKVEMDMRISIVPITNGESIVLRIFNRKGSLLSLDELGFSAGVGEKIRKLCSMPHGLVLFTGPTGSGKTTSLNAIISRMDCESDKIITIEDPVEYSIPGVNQIQTNDEISLTFGSLLRRVLRQDPNVIMVGEIRDSETAGLAVRAALTGHLVFSSLHTNDAVSSVRRLIDMGVEAYLLAAVLRGVVAQRLVRVLCPACGSRRVPSPAERRLYYDYGLEPDLIYDGEGCSACGMTGYRGRTGIAECFIKSRELEELISGNCSAAGLSARLEKEGMELLLHDGLSKTVDGVTGIGEIERIM